MSSLLHQPQFLWLMKKLREMVLQDAALLNLVLHDTPESLDWLQLAMVWRCRLNRVAVTSCYLVACNANGGLQPFYVFQEL